MDPEIIRLMEEEQRMSKTEDWLVEFIRESNRIEGVVGVSDDDVWAHTYLLSKGPPETRDLEAFVAGIAAGHRLRDKIGMDVRVGDHVPPRGGPAIRARLNTILAALQRMHALETPYDIHLAYEHLHPFTDGNGRSGRALWLWQMLRTPEAEAVKRRGFLHSFYYQALAAGDHHV